MLQTKFATGPEAGWIGSATVLGMFIGAAGQGQFSDRWGRKTIYQFNLLLFGIFTILGALAPTVWWLVAARFIAGIGLGGEQPLAFAYAGEYSPKAIRGRILAIVHFIGGACVWPIASLFTLFFRDSIGWRGVWIVIGIGALIVWLFRFWLPESPRYLATHGKGEEALGVLARLGIAGPKEQLVTGAASDTKSDPFAIVFKMFPIRVIAGFIMIFCLQVAGNSMQIFASEVFPTNARASGFGWAAGVGRLATAGIVPAIIWIRTGWGLTTVFVCLAAVLLIAAVSVTQLGPEAKQKGLDEIAPPTG